MVRLLIILFLIGNLISAHAQNLTGKWVGYFTTSTGMTYTYEVNIEDDGNANLTATTFTRFSNVNTAKASAKGVFTRSSKLASILETKFDQINLAPNTQACLMSNYLTYYNVNGREILQGTYISNNITGKSDCGTGTVVLTKELIALSIKKTNKTTNKLIKKDNSQQAANKKQSDTIKTSITATTEIQVKETKDEPLTNFNAEHSKNTVNSNVNNTTIEAPIKKKKFMNIPWVLISRDNKLIKTITTNNKKISIDLFDNGSFESDSISVYDNNVLLFDRIKLSYKEFHFELKFDDQTPIHELVLVAHKSGNATRNSSILIYKDEVIKEEFIISTNNKTNAKIIVKLDPKVKTSSD